jgi:hypothetical protein
VIVDRRLAIVDWLQNEMRDYRISRPPHPTFWCPLPQTGARELTLNFFLSRSVNRQSTTCNPQFL